MKNLQTFDDFLNEAAMDKQPYWVKFTKELSKLFKYDVTLMDFDSDKYTRSIELELPSGAGVTISHDWGSSGDGTSTKPSTTIRAYPNEPKNIGRFAIWDNPAEYAEDIFDMIKNN